MLLWSCAGFCRTRAWIVSGWISLHSEVAALGAGAHGLGQRQEGMQPSGDGEDPAPFGGAGGVWLVSRGHHRSWSGPECGATRLGVGVGNVFLAGLCSLVFGYLKISLQLWQRVCVQACGRDGEEEELASLGLENCAEGTKSRASCSGHKVDG